MDATALSLDAQLAAERQRQRFAEILLANLKPWSAAAAHAAEGGLDLSYAAP